MLRPLPVLSLPADFLAVTEAEYHPAIRTGRCVIHKFVKQLLVEIYQ